MDPGLDTQPFYRRIISPKYSPSLSKPAPIYFCGLTSRYIIQPLCYWLNCLLSGIPIAREGVADRVLFRLCRDLRRRGAAAQPPCAHVPQRGEPLCLSVVAFAL